MSWEAKLSTFNERAREGSGDRRAARKASVGSIVYWDCSVLAVVTIGARKSECGGPRLRETQLAKRARA